MFKRNPIRLKLYRTCLLAIVAIFLFSKCRLTLQPIVYAQNLEVTSSLTDQQTITPNEKIELHFNRLLQAFEGKFAVLIGQTDMTAFFISAEQSLSYIPNLIPLPEGENQLTIYLVSPTNDWKQIARFTFKVSEEKKIQQTEASQKDSTAQQSSQGEKKKSFADKIGITPSITFGIKSQPAEAHFPNTNAPARSQFTDTTLQGTLRTEMKNDKIGYQSQFDIAGSSFQQETLRFSQLGKEAPDIDLASYVMQFDVNKTKVQVGHIAFGTNRFLINSFSSRGIVLTIPVTSYSDFSIASMNGTSIIGYDNFFGLNRRKHQIVAGTLGFDLLPKRPGGLRIETGLLYGSLQPISNVNQGSITDAEQNKGLSFRIVTSDPKQRLKLDAGFAKSHFNNANDPLLNQDSNLVAVHPVTRNAEYVDATYNILQNLKITETKQANLTLNLHHERIDPLFRSVAVFTQADRFQNQFEIVGAVGEMNAAFSHQRLNDNLANIPSILKTLTRRNALLLGAPLAAFLSRTEKPSVWLPRLSYIFDSTHQFAGNLPINGNFNSVSQIPDQVSANQLFSAEWQMQSLRFAYRFNRSLQDNRQLGRELADLKNTVNGFSIVLPTFGKFNLGVDVNVERANNRESSRTDRTLRIASNINWRMSKSTNFTANVSGAGAGDAAQTTRNRNAEFDLQWTYQFTLGKERFKKMQGQFFIRYANHYASLRDNIFGLNNLTKAQTLNTGLSFTFF